MSTLVYRTASARLESSVATSARAPVIDFQQITKRFGKHLALDNVSLSIEGGQIFGLLGPNGAGKTTLLRILSTLLRPDSGSATLAGFDVVKQPLLARAQLGLVNATMGLYQRLTGRENLHFFAELAGMSKAMTEARCESLMQQLDIGSWIDQKSAGYSTGMRQKIIVARATMHSPKVLVLDEASNGLDVFARRALIDLAHAYAQQGNLVVYCTHIMSEVEALCRHAAILHEGKLLEACSIAELLAKTRCADLESAFFALASARRTSLAEAARQTPLAEAARQTPRELEL